ncbi:MAG: cbb3-type cytochrome c oxidase subunit I, partial [Pseudomonadota bacterium]
PVLWNRERLYSLQLVNVHFWLATVGIVIYAAGMWVSGVMQGLMWRATDDLGLLVYSFSDSVAAMYPFYVIRLFGGFLYLLGALVMAYNIWRTIRGDVREAPASTRRAAAVPAE